MNTLVPIFDLAERDRRWARLRQLMATEQVDCLIGFPNSGHWDLFQAGLRYITQIGGNTTEVAVVFPLDGEVTAFVRGPNEVAWWGSQSQWITDLQVTRRAWAPGVIERLRELRLDGAHIGIIGLSGSPRAPEGLVASGIVDALREELPRARFSSATELVARARAVKSPAEIGFIRNACGLAEKAAQVMVETARPGVPEREVLGSMVKAIIVGGGEIPSMLHWGAGPEPPWPHRLVTNRLLQANDIINNEIEAKWAGYVAQVVQPMVLGDPHPEQVRLFETSRAIFSDLLPKLKPGATFASIVDDYQRQVREAGCQPGAALMHGRGLGEDPPLVHGRGSVDPELRLEEGNVFIFKPAVFPPEGDVVQSASGLVTELAVRAGDTVVVTANGARRLGRRPLEIATPETRWQL
jgi:Xaa-Pro dipeptidase